MFWCNLTTALLKQKLTQDEPALEKGHQRVTKDAEENQENPEQPTTPFRTSLDHEAILSRLDKQEHVCQPLT